MFLEKFPVIENACIGTKKILFVNKLLQLGRYFISLLIWGFKQIKKELHLFTKHFRNLITHLMGLFCTLCNCKFVKVIKHSIYQDFFSFELFTLLKFLELFLKPFFFKVFLFLGNIFFRTIYFLSAILFPDTLYWLFLLSYFLRLYTEFFCYLIS